MKYFVILLLIIGIAGTFLVPINSAQGLPLFLDCTHDSDFIISTNKLEFTPGETFVLNVKTKQNDTTFEMVVINPKGQEVFTDVVGDADESGYTQARFHIPDDALKGTWSIFVTANPSQQQEVIFIGVDETPKSMLSIKSSSVNYEYKVDDASFLIAGESNTDVQVNVLDHNDGKIHVYIITLPPEGKCNFTLNLDGYKPGVYGIEITDHNDKTTATFTVGLQPSALPIEVITDSVKYSSGETVLLSVTSGPMIKLHMSIMDPFGKVVEKILAITDPNGRLSKSFTLPQNATAGIWQAKAATGTNFGIAEFKVKNNLTFGEYDEFGRDCSKIPCWGGPIFYPPLKQFKSGVPFYEIQCRDSLVLVTKHDDSPACVKPETKPKLMQRDWIKNNDGITTNFSFCGEDGFDSEGNLNSDNSTHHWDANKCEWQYIGPESNSINKWAGAPIYKEQKENEN